MDALGLSKGCRRLTGIPRTLFRGRYDGCWIGLGRCVWNIVLRIDYVLGRYFARVYVETLELTYLPWWVCVGRYVCMHGIAANRVTIRMSLFLFPGDLLGTRRSSTS